MDIDLAVLIRNSLTQDERLSAQEIDVSVVEGIATLTGAVQSYRRKLTALEIAESIHGCRGVIDKLTVKPVGQVPDKEIAENVRSALDANADITKEVISVSIAAGIVTLRGNIASQWEKALAEDITLSTRGVREVHSFLFVEPELKIEDEELAQQIESALSNTSGLRNADIRAAVINVTAVLSGRVPELWQKKKAEQVVSRFPVVLVRNEIIVGDS
jgi:osmotically-inducible protein OsmY